VGTIDISKVDRNFAGEGIRYEGLKIYSARDRHFHIYGLYQPYEGGGFKRMPSDAAAKMKGSIQELYTHTSGGRIRFCTDSARIFLRAVLPQIVRFDHMPKTGSSYFDLYVDGVYWNVFRHGLLNGLEQKELPPNAYDASLTLGGRKMREILIHFPLYNPVDDVFIGLDEDAQILPAAEYTYQKPVVFYGSSITQGGCASHAGNAYFNILSRRLDTDIVNLGFSSGCHGEDAMAEYLSTLDMSALVYDYDHNAGSVEELKQTHERAFRIIRDKQPNLPVIMISAADRMFGIPARKEIIRRTYQNAVDAGDKNVYFIDGGTIYAPVGRDLCTVDHIHPNDTGFLMMANAVEPVLRRILAENAPCAM